MQDIINLTGIVLKQIPVKEYDRQITLLTKEKGKITVFANGSRKPGNKLAAVNPFSFGVFKIYAGRRSYSMEEANIQTYFEELRTDYIAACFGLYFCEVCDYYAVENNEDVELLKLLYQSLRALTKESLDNNLVKCIFEIKTIVAEGEYPGAPAYKQWDEATLYALDYIVNSSIEKLYTFKVSDRVLEELEEIAANYCKNIIGHSFKSLEVLKNLY